MSKKYKQRSQADLKKKYGTSADAVRGKLVAVTFNLGDNSVKMNVHKSVAKYIKAAIKEYRALVKAGTALAYTLKATYCGSFNWRLIKHADGTTGTNLSMHSFGIAVDFNAWNPNGQGTNSVSDIPKQLVTVMNKHGFYWGGDWAGSSRDPMHFEYAPKSSFDPAPVPAPKKKVMPTIKKGSKGADVKICQKIIGVKADGDFGALTEADTKAWQKKKGLAADGAVGPKTWAKAGY
jgi:hypothetical protein